MKEGIYTFKKWIGDFVVNGDFVIGSNDVTIRRFYNDSSLPDEWHFTIDDFLRLINSYKSRREISFLHKGDFLIYHPLPNTIIVNNDNIHVLHFEFSSSVLDKIIFENNL